MCSVLWGPPDQRDEVFEKYGSRGWLFYSNPSGVLQHPEYLLRCRWVGNSRCWFMPWSLPNHGYNEADIVFGNTWTTQTHRKSSPSPRMFSPVRLHYTIFRTRFPDSLSTFLTLAGPCYFTLNMKDPQERQVIHNEWYGQLLGHSIF